jgi:hypothetical protein
VSFLVGFGNYVTCHARFGRNPSCLDGFAKPLMSSVAGFSKPLQLSGLNRLDPTSLMAELMWPTLSFGPSVVTWTAADFLLEIT